MAPKSKKKMVVWVCEKHGVFGCDFTDDSGHSRDFSFCDGRDEVCVFLGICDRENDEIERRYHPCPICAPRC